MMTGLTIFEFDRVFDTNKGPTGLNVPSSVFTWLESQCIKYESTGSWLKLTHSGGARAIQVTNYVGVIRAPCGYQIEVLPKTGKNTSPEKARQLLIDMLSSLPEFRHIQTASADLMVKKMPLLEVFINQFLSSVNQVIKRGLRSDYVSHEKNIFALRGRLKIVKHISQNLVRCDRFFTEHDEYMQNRPENRLIHTALRNVITFSKSRENQRLARELSFVFDDVPVSNSIEQDIKNIRLDRGMSYYSTALQWAQLIIKGFNPLTGFGSHHAASLLFPMEALFEAYVEKGLRKQVKEGFFLKSQSSARYLVTHKAKQWFKLKPDLIIKSFDKNQMVLDAKWKLLDTSQDNSRQKYQLSQADFYQMYAYGNYYLNGHGNIILIYPKTDLFLHPLATFDFKQSAGMRLWVLPFCLETKKLLLDNVDDNVKSMLKN
jgi:5-methylcytosine-specific restriction enzyme subunit McrC